MAKQGVPFNFSGGLDTKTDPYQIDFGDFFALDNTVFTVKKRLTKRNGYGNLPSVSSEFLTTLRGDLTAIGPEIEAYSAGARRWTSIDNFYPCNLSTLSIYKSSTNQSQVDSVISSSGLICVAWTDQNPSSLSTKQFKYAIYDATTGQLALAPQIITDADTTYGSPRVFILGNYFIVAYTSNNAGTNKIKAIPVSMSSFAIQTAIVIASAVTPNALVAWDASIMNGSLYFAWNGAGGSGLKMAYLSSTLALSSTINPDLTHLANLVSVCADDVGGVVYATYYDSGTTDGYTVAVDGSLNVLTNFPTASIVSTAVVNIASCVAETGTLTLFLEITNAYSYDAAVASNYVATVTVDQSTGVASGQTVVIRSVGLASKAFIVDAVPYFLSAYSSPFQPTFYLIDGSNGNIVSQLAYSNGGGYLTHGLPYVSLNDNVASVAYLNKDFIQAVSDANSAGTVVVGGIYSQTGISQASFLLGTDAKITSVELGENLNLTAGFLWGYDGTQATEQGFFLYPDSVECTSHPTTGGHLAAQIYYYAVIYSWTDNRGNIFRSSVSIPIKVDLTAAGTATSEAVLQGPNLRLTYKTNVKIEIYRWSTAQQNFFQVTSISTPTLNSTSTDSWTFTDTLADATIAGNELLYTTGGVLEDSASPALVAAFTFDDRLFGIDAEDRNLLRFSKQVIEATPIEMCENLTLYVAPSIGAQGPTGDMNCGAQMDDKLILFKTQALNYINGTGPDNTGANSGYSQPIFITSMIGCSNQASIIFQPQGLMFEFASEAGNQIWLLGRDLSTHYIGAAVERYTNSATVLSSVAVPGTNEVRFFLSSGVTLKYDYFYGKWGTHSIRGVSSTLFQGLHTFVNAAGAVFQETPGLYLDGSHPVLISFTTGWINPQGVRGYERIHEVGFLGTYYSPHKLVVQVAYDYGAPQQQSIYTPTNYTPAYGDAPIYGDGTYGGPGNIENFRVFTKKQKCKAFQLIVREIFDPSFGTTSGAGLSLSGLNLVMTFKKGWSPIPQKNSVG